jgi:hypothetical protein
MMKKILCTSLALFALIAGHAQAQTRLQCSNTNAIPVPFDITLNEAAKSGTIKMQYSKATWCEFLTSNWVYSPDEIRFDFSYDPEDCGKSLTDLSAKLNRKTGVLYVAQKNGRGDLVDMSCRKMDEGNKF